MRFPCLTEHDEQVALCRVLDAYRITYCAIPNAGKRSFRTAAKLKAEGLQPGFPDLLILDVPAGSSIRGCAVEMKRSKGGKLAPAQSAWLDKLHALGWAVIVAKGSSDALVQLGALGYGRRQ